VKSILFSFLTIGVVSALAIGASQAFFSDSETSAENTFIAGSLNLKVGSTASYNGSPVAASTWDQKDLDRVSSEKFFNFTDLKPGDKGENTIVFSVDNSAWMCAGLEITQNSNLGKYLNLVWWIDDGDNIYESGEKALYGGPRTIDGWLALVGTQAGGTGTLPLTLADSVSNWTTWPAATPNTLAIPADTPQHLGVGWCFGNLVLDESQPYGFSCDGTEDQNDAQGSSIIGNLSFSVIQSRNNADYLCPEHTAL